MADILIRGMEMPKYTTKAEFGIDADGNPLCMVHHADCTEPDIYDVVSLPEGHGRLIDADALLKHIYEYWIGNLWWFEGRVDEMPTIIEAEGGVEDG